jgi:myo-inositol 2-dehydrogenase/D-chiro-inositol 1-dehydrogenase
LVLLHLADDGVVEVEVFVNCQYGYDVRCEVVGSTGTVSLDDPATVTVVRAARQTRTIPDDWRTRFADAYRDELQEWVDAVADDEIRGPSAWDGYAATAVAENCVAAVVSGTRNVALADRPALYELK